MAWLSLTGLGLLIATLLVCAAWATMGVALNLPATLGIAASVVAVGAVVWSLRRQAGPLSPRWHRRARRAVVTLGVIAALTAAVGAGAWALTPGVGNAEALAHARTATHRQPPPETLAAPRVVAALLTVQDPHFYTNQGLDLPAVLHATIDLAHGHGQNPATGTVEQRLAAILYQNPHPHRLDPLRQLALAVKLAHTWPKTKILQMYLATASYGHGYDGLTAAATGYFHTVPGRLDWAQAALLATLLQDPTGNDPYQHPADARTHRNQVLSRLLTTGAITSSQAADSSAEPLLP